ncbi:hypothetical protein V7119_26695, partial [Bacillus toyonensis]|uniref:hypothetical protein n=1 Tax=Bacillus toyonensis TaxID=155322 RepID=UPI002FFE7982
FNKNRLVPTWYPIYFCTYFSEKEEFYTKNKDSYGKRKSRAIISICTIAALDSICFIARFSLKNLLNMHNCIKKLKFIS